MSNELKNLSEKAKEDRRLREHHYLTVELSDDPRQYHRNPGKGCNCGACEKLFKAATPT